LQLQKTKNDAQNKYNTETFFMDPITMEHSTLSIIRYRMPRKYYRGKEVRNNELDNEDLSNL